MFVQRTNILEKGRKASHGLGFLRLPEQVPAYFDNLDIAGTIRTHRGNYLRGYLLWCLQGVAGTAGRATTHDNHPQHSFQVISLLGYTNTHHSSFTFYIFSPFVLQSSGFFSSTFSPQPNHHSFPVNGTFVLVDTPSTYIVTYTFYYHLSTFHGIYLELAQVGGE